MKPCSSSRVNARLAGAASESCSQTGAALLLPRLLAGRAQGPVFLADPAYEWPVVCEQRPTRS